MKTLSLEDGKYKLEVHPGGEMRALRYDVPWRNLNGDKLIGAMFDVIEAKSKIEEKATPWRVEEMGPHFRKLHLSVGSAAVQLHHFTGPDLYEPHDHPYAFTSYIVAGGYVEEVWTRGEGSEWVKQVVHRLPGTMHRVEADTVHKIVHLLADDCITAVTWLPEGKKRREPRFWKPWLTPTLCRLHNEPDNWVVA